MGKIKLIVVQCKGFSQNTDWAAAFTSLITGKFCVSHLPALHQAVAALLGATLCSAFYSKHPGGFGTATAPSLHAPFKFNSFLQGSG